MKNYYLTKKLNSLVSTILVLLGLKEESVGLGSTNTTSLIDFNTRNSFGIYSFKAALALLFVTMFSVSNVQGQVTVAGAVTGDGTYTTLSAAFAAIPATQTAANITVTITANTSEPAGGATLVAGTWSSLTIAPSGGSWTITGAATAGIPLINFNGSDNVTINGGGNLTISNTTASSTSGTSTLKLIGDATNNTFNNVSFLGSSITTLASNGGTVWISTGSSTGNDNNAFQSCKFGAAGANLPSKAIYGNGSTTNATIANSNVTINNCEIYDFFLAGGGAGVYASSGNTNWNVTNNKIYQTASRTITSSMYGVYFVSTTYGDNVQVTGNTIGYSSNAATGTLTLSGAGSFYGINFSGNSAGTNANNLNNNTVSDISYTSGSGAFYGIYNVSGATANTVNINGNTIKNITLASTGTCYGVNWSSATNLSVSNNTVNNITRSAAGTIYCIYSGSSSVNETVSGNTVRDISNTSVSSNTIYGIYQNTASGTKLFQNNTVYNLTGNAGMTLYGVYVGYGTTVDISGNKVYGLTNTGGTGGTIYGIGRGSSATTVDIYKNKVYDISTSSTGGILYGVYIVGGATTNIYNNLVGGLTASAATNTGLAGMYFSGGTAINAYYNTVYLSGTSSGAGFGSSAVYANSTPTVDLRNNIFINASTATGSGLAAAYRRSSTTLTSYASTSNNNMFFGSATFTDGTNTDASLAAFQTRLADSRDAASKSQNPTFASTTGSNANFLNFAPGAINFAGGTAQVLASPFDVDFSGAARSGTAPDMGGFEFAEGVASVPSITSFTPSNLCVVGGQTVTITGTDLDSVTSVLFNGASGVNLAGTITAQTSTTLTVTAPANVVTGIIRVANAAGSADSFLNFIAEPSPTIGVTSGSTICAGTGTSLTATGGATYAWSPGTGLSATTGATVTASPTATTTYTVTGTSAAGCSATNTVTITVDPAPSAITIVQNPAIACLGGVTTLTANGGTAGSAGSATIGSGTSLTSSSGYPTAFGNYWYQDWHQYLFTKAELNAAGITSAGNITSLKLTIAATNNPSTAIADYNVKIASTSNTALSAFTTSGLTNVFGPASVTGVVGVNTITFSTPYVWDGVSNIIVDIRETASYGSGNATTYYTSTTNNSVLYAYSSSSNATFWSSSPTPTTSTSRPNVTFGYSSSIPTVFSWATNTTDLYTTNDTSVGYTNENISTVYSKSTSPQTYTVTSTLGSCSSSAEVTVTPNALPTIAVSDAAICNGGAGTTLTASGGTSYAWTPATGLSATNVANPTANPSATTTYTITGTDANGCVNTTTATVTVNNPVAITGQPANVVALLGSSNDFTVTATATGVTYQWQVDTGSGFANITGETNATLTVTATVNASYRCVVSGTSPCTPVTSNAATLTISSVSFLTQPADQTICSNANATYSVTTDGAVTSYQWQLSTDSGSTWANVPGETTTTLVLSGQTAASSGYLFRCVLNGSVNSNSALLTVYDAVAITTPPANQSSCAGSNATFTVAATGSGLSYQWQFSTNGGTTWNNVASAGTTASYVVTSPTGALNNNQYQVIVSGTAPCSAVTSAAATLTVTDVTVAASLSSFCFGGSTTLTASFVGAPDYTTATWTSTAGSGALTPVSGASATVTPTAAGTYVYTFATNGTCPFSKTVSVTVNARPTITSATATPTSVCSDATINLAAASIVNANGTAALGAGASTGSGTATTIFPGTWGGAKSQYLIKASELTALGFAAGGLTSIGFEPTTSGQTYQGFSLSINTTATTVLTSTFIAPGTQVYAGTLTDTGFTPVAGSVNTLAFGTGSGSASSFAWDGTSNVVLTFCWTSVPGASTASNSSMKYDNAGFTSTTYKQADNQAPAAMLAQTSGTTSTSRPRFTFGGVLATNLTSTYTWAWDSSPAVTTATGTTSVTNATGAPITQTFTATATANGCSSSLAATAVTINSTIPAPTGTDSAQCGTDTPTASVAGSGRPGATFKWYTVATGGTALAGQSASALVAPYTVSTTTNFYVSEASADGLCESARTLVTVTVATPYAFTLSSSTATNCTGSASLTPVTIATNGGYDTYSWSNSGTVSGDETLGWTFSPTTTTTYTLTASGGGCSTTATVVVTPTALPIISIAPPAAICVGASSTLTALTTTISAGSATIGAGATTSATYSNPFYSAWSNTHTQHIVLASELTAMGLKAGNITSVALDVTSAGTLPMIDLSVKIGTTAATTMAAFVSNVGFQTVYTNASLMPTVGVNTITFSAPFNWDGTSNLVLEFCHGNSASTATMSRTVKADVTAYVSSIKAQVSAATSAATICGNTTTNLLTYSTRPQFIFGGQVGSQGVGTLAYTWNDPLTTTGNVLTVSPASTTAYTVSGYDSVTGCTGTAIGTVTVYDLPTAPLVTSAIQCGPGVPLVSVADTNSYTTPTYKWYADNVTTTALQASTSTTYTTSVSTTTTFYVSVLSPGGCESPRTAVTTTVVTPATLTVSPDVAICEAGNTTLTASGAVTYEWSPALGLDATTGASVTATPSATTTYSVTGVDSNGCTTAAATVKVTVNTYPTAVTATASSASVCNGGTIDLTASATGPAGAGYNFSEGFESFPTPPVGWAFFNAGSGSAWGYSDSDARTGTYALAIAYDPDFAANSWAITPAQNLTGGVTYTISYWYNTTSGGGLYEENLKLTVGTLATVAGQTTTLLNQPGLINETYAQATVTYTPSVSGTYYFGLNGYSAADKNLLTVDDFSITAAGTSEALTYAWTSSPAGFTSSVQNPTGVVVTEDSTFTVTAYNGTCGTSATTTTVTTLALPEFTLENATICNGGSTLLTATGAGNSYLWSPAGTLSATSGNAVTANPSTTTTYTVKGTNISTGCTFSKTVTVTVLTATGITSITPTTSTIIPNQATSFTVVATGTTLAYQWQVNDGSGWVNVTNSSLYEGANSDQLGLKPNQTTAELSGYLYRCLVSGAAPCSVETSSEVSLFVDSTGITTNPSNTTVCEGASASFTTIATSENPEDIITYTWEYKVGAAAFVAVPDGFDSVTGLTFSGIDASILSMTGTTVANTGIQFHCIVNGYIPSSDVALTVKKPAAITVQPSNQTVCVSGGTATFSTTATGDDLAYQWQFSTNGGTSWANYAGTGATSSSIAILNPALGTDGYQYHVIVSGNAACGSATSDAATLNINNPTITSQPTTATVIRGNTATFTVVASAATGYQWEYSANGTTGWASITDAVPTGNTYTGATSASLSVITSDLTATGNANYYRCVVTNAGCTVTSNSAQMDVKGYCIPSAATSAVSYFDQVTINGDTGFDNSGSAFSTNGYGNFTASYSASQILGGAVTYNTTLMGTTVGVAIWVDWNQNGTFETTERVANTTGYVSVFTGSFAVPMTATLGTTRMRIMMDYNSSNPSNPCVQGTRAETEDYTFTVLAQPACSGAPIAVASAESASLCSGGTGTTLTLAGSTSGVTGISYQWYSSTDNVTFAPVSGETTTTLATGSLTASTYYYAAVTCANGGSTTNSNTVTIIVNNPQITGSTPAAICGTGTAVLEATANAGSTINWYVASTGGSPLYTGASFTTPSIAATTTYYAEAVSGGGSATIGAASPSVGAYGTSFTGSYEIFTVATPVTITSVNAYATAAGTVTVELLSSTGTLLQTSPTYTITAGQANTTLSVVGTPISIPVGFNITPGTDYRLNFKTGSTATLVRNSAGAATTYGPVLGLTITGNSNFAAGYYYNFYNWSISSGCSSTRTAVIATVDPLPTATISYAGSPYCSNAASASVTLTGTNAYTGGTFTASPAGLTLDATTGAIDPSLSTAGTYTITYTTNATAYCAPQTATTTVTVNPSTLNAGFTYASAIYCTNSATASPIVTGFAGTFTSSAGLSINATTGAINFATSTPGSYTVTNTVSACSSSDVVTFDITVNQAPVIGTQPASVTACAGANASFTVAASGTGVTYQWEENSGSGWAVVVDGGVYSNAGTASLSITGATLAMNAYQYRAIVSDTSGCGTITSGAATLTVSQPVAATFTPANPTVCSNGIQMITAATPSFAQPGIIGAGAVSNTTNIPFRGFYGGIKVQYLYTAAELLALGYTNGTSITSLGMDVTAYTGPYTYNDFTIGMKNTASTVLTTTFETGLTTVKTPSNYVLTGTAPFTATVPLTTNFTWDGTSNVLIEFCFNNNNGGGSSSNSANSKSTTMATNMSTYYSADNNATVCSNTTGTTSTTRVNMRFGVVSGTTTWSPVTGLYTNAAATTAYVDGANASTVYVKTTSTTEYTATVTNLGGCSNTSTTTVTVLPGSTLGSIVQPVATCAGQPTTFSLSGLVPNSTSTIAYTVNAVVQTPITGVVADANGNGSLALALAAFTNGQTLAITAITRTDVVPANCATAITANNTVVISVNALPTATVTGTTSVCQDGTAPTVTFTATTGTAPFTFTYTLNGGTPETITAVVGNSVTLAAPTGTVGVFTYQLVSVSGANCSQNQAGSAVITVTVNTVTLSSAVGTDAQSACSGTPITPITYSTTGATGATFSGLPTGVTGSLTGNVVTISGTPTVTGEFSYKITLTGGCGSAIAMGSITVNAPTSNTTTVVACGTYTWAAPLGNGQTYTTPQTGLTNVSTNAAGCTHTETLELTFSCSSVVNLKMFVEGYYTGSGTMASVKNNQDYVSSTTEVEELTVELHDATTYALVATTTATLNTDGTMICTFSSAPSGSFYIAVKGSNLVQTWSADPQTVGGTPLSYDFTTSASQAYSDNMKEVETGVWAFYSGDINQDEVVDGSDSTDVINDVENFAFGVLATDLNGDGVVDGTDTTFLINNVENFIFSSHP